MDDPALIKVQDGDKVEVFDTGWPTKQVGVYVTAKGQAKFHNKTSKFMGRRFDMTRPQWKKLRSAIDAIFGMDK